MKRVLFAVSIITVVISCAHKAGGKKFEVSGIITNNPAKVIYLEEIPMATMQRIVADSVIIGKDGKYSLRADTREATAYTLRLDKEEYPLAALINDVSKITVNATFNKENTNYAETYDVKGSKASQQLKDFMMGLNTNLQSIFYNSRKADSLKNAGASDSAIAILQNDNSRIATETKALLTTAIAKSENAALTMFVLGNYQTMANNPGFKLEPVSNEEVNKIVGDVAAKFPAHQGVVSIKNMLDAQANKAKGLVGQQAPEITLPDVNGKEVKLSSFRGKYVLVDFWASWCRPCRAENPNVVKAYNKFKDKNFTILGVSLDKPGEKDKWLAAIKADNLGWTHVSDLKEWESIVVPAYNFGETGIPFNVLIDPAGKVIAEGLRGEELESRLAEILK